MNHEHDEHVNPKITKMTAQFWLNVLFTHFNQGYLTSFLVPGFNFN